MVLGRWSGDRVLGGGGMVGRRSHLTSASGGVQFGSASSSIFRGGLFGPRHTGGANGGWALGVDDNGGGPQSREGALLCAVGPTRGMHGN